MKNWTAIGEHTPIVGPYGIENNAPVFRPHWMVHRIGRGAGKFQYVRMEGANGPWKLLVKQQGHVLAHI